MRRLRFELKQHIDRGLRPKWTAMGCCCYGLYLLLTAQTSFTVCLRILWRPSKVEMGADNIVCVTGSWAMLGSWIVRLLLEKGYVVRYTIRISSEETTALMACPGAEQRLEFVTMDVLNYNSLARTIEGCSSVIHTPAPHDMNGLRDYPADMIEYEVKGILNIVEACANSATVQRLVLTSCLSTIIWTQRDEDDEKCFDEKCWTNVDFCRERKLWSPLSKTLAEKAAWALARDKDLDMVVLNPATVVSPKTIPTQRIRKLQRDEVFAYVSIEDVAIAHVLALEKPNASGRYICVENVVIGSDVKRCKQILSNKKLLSLGMNLNLGSSLCHS